jgi:hypothetical protein
MPAPRKMAIVRTNIAAENLKNFAVMIGISSARIILGDRSNAPSGLHLQPALQAACRVAAERTGI